MHIPKNKITLNMDIIEDIERCLVSIDSSLEKIDCNLKIELLCLNT